MSWKLLRNRLLYLAASAFVAWHTLAIFVAPMPNDSPLAQSLRSVLQPYLTLFMLDNKWNFYSPNVGAGEQFRYVVEDAAGNTRTFSPIEEVSWWHPSYWWFKAWHIAIANAPDVHGASVAALLCEKHASLKPVAITLLYVLQKDFLPADYLAGKNPLDPEFIEVTTLERVKCPEN